MPRLIEYVLEGHGWAQGAIVLSGRRTGLDASYIHDTFKDIVEALLIVLRHKLQRERPFNLRRERCFDFAPQHGQRDRMTASLTIRRRRMVAIEFGT